MGPTSDPVVDGAALEAAPIGASWARVPVRWVLGLGGVVVLSAALLLVAVVVVCSVVLGWDATTVSSGSMSPSLRTGDIAVFRAASDDIAVGTIIRFDDADGRSIVHRVVEASVEGGYQTKGDANAQEDADPVFVESVEGVLALVVPFIGTPELLVDRGAWAGLAVLLVVLVAAGWHVRYMLDPVHDPWRLRPFGRWGADGSLVVFGRKGPWIGPLTARLADGDAELDDQPEVVT